MARWLVAVVFLAGCGGEELQPLYGWTCEVTLPCVEDKETGEAWETTDYACHFTEVEARELVQGHCGSCGCTLGACTRSDTCL